MPSGAARTSIDSKSARCGGRVTRGIARRGGSTTCAPALGIDAPIIVAVNRKSLRPKAASSGWKSPDCGPVEAADACRFLRFNARDGPHRDIRKKTQERWSPITISGQRAEAWPDPALGAEGRRISAIEGARDGYRAHDDLRSSGPARIDKPRRIARRHARRRDGPHGHRPRAGVLGPAGRRSLRRTVLHAMGDAFLR